MATVKETLIKTFIWRFIATIITISIGWYVSGNFEFGLAIGSADTLIKTVGYFGFERFWNKISTKPSEN
jgi:uncharacterized membrane protein